MSAAVRAQLVAALRLDLIGPGGGLGAPGEELSQAPSKWYLTCSVEILVLANER